MDVIKSAYNLSLPSITFLGNTLVLAVIALAAFGFSYRFFAAMAGLAAIEAICIFIKLAYFKERPNRQKFSNIIERLDASGFPSVHAARSVFVYLYLAVFAGLLERIVLIGIIAAIGISRLLLKKHYLVDVLAGYALGISLFLAFTILK
jgi:membrane-associated phospholipid phosphatase